MRNLFLASLVTWLSIQGVSAQLVDPNAVDGHLHIKLVESSVLDLDNYTGGILALDLLLVPYGIDTIYRPFKLPGHPLDKVYRVRFTAVSLVNALVTALEALTFVEFAEKMPLGIPAFQPNDLAPEQYYLPLINAPAAWGVERGSADVTIAVVDNGVAIEHEDLWANIRVNEAEANGISLVDDDLNGYADDIYGYDTADRNANPRPPAGETASVWSHGTHVAGIAAAVTDNGAGIAGLAHGCRILPVKVARNSGNGQRFETPMDGVFYASRCGAQVINMSWGNYMHSQVMRLVMQEAAANGAVLIAAAGNQDTEDDFYPAAFPEVISVGATDWDDRKAGFSNFGQKIDVMAPGASIHSSMAPGGNTYGAMSGTSMAAPLVSGLAALLLSHHPDMPASEVKQRIIDGCAPIDHLNPGYEGKLGAGRIDAAASLGITGITRHEGLRSLALYPNPTEAGAHVRIVGSEGMPVRAWLHDLTGRAVSQLAADSRGLTLPPDALSGIYAIRMAWADGRTASMLICVR